MLQRIVQLFHRYASHHVRLQRPGFALRDPEGGPAGFVDRITVNAGMILIEGWTSAREVVLRLGSQENRVVPTLKRTDAAQALGLDVDAPLGFAIAMPWVDQVGALELLFDGAQGVVHDVLLFSEREKRLARRRMLAPFIKDAARAVPHVLRWYRHRDPAARQAVKRILRLGQTEQTRLLDSAVLNPGSPVETDDTPVCIIIPIYNAFDLLAELFDRVTRHTDIPYHLVLIEDCSPDERVRPFVRDWMAGQPEGRVTLIENPQNKGFVGSVNSGFDVAAERGEDVILLNSDALVPADWARRLLAPIRSDDQVATVTPMSNDAEIFTAPRICERVDIGPGAVDAIDARAASLSVRQPWVEVPTGVGFCMAMARRYLDMVPHLDTAFGRGYGEEVDWCQKIRAKGGRHVAQPGLFVEHRGGVSFGSEAKLQMILENNDMIARRYPHYDREVQEFIRDDPLATTRLALGVASLAAQGHGPIPVYMAHSMGGGAEIYLQGRIDRDVETVGGVIVLRVGGMVRWQVELVTEQGVQGGGTNEFDAVLRLLEPLEHRHVIYSCGVGHPDPAQLPDRIMALAAGNAELSLLMNDYFPLSPSFNLLNSAGVFAGVPDEGDDDSAHRARRPDGSTLPLADWRAAWRPVMARADEVRVFSENGRDLVVAAFPEAENAVRVVPHALPHAVPRLPQADPEAPPVIGVLGNIGFIKGAGVLADLSKVVDAHKGVSLVVLGIVDPDYPLASSATIHGGYNVAELPDLVARYGITDWLIPSICPETFSYTTHEALATGLPVWSFDLGAQGEAVARATGQGAPGGVIALPPEGIAPKGLLEILLKRDPAASGSASRGGTCAETPAQSA
ncbi:glycosyltransferase [Tateyamaria sp. SN3-11]|uniref:glycosyltransferase n=1 Tax=Tateyamaria sp. SN3-11 TaxID=3092147 RepID=UPI0039E85670